MSFRCLFIIRVYDLDNTDLQPYCYKPFDNINKIKMIEHPNSIPLKNFNDWYQCVLKTISDSNYTNFDESTIKDYLCNPIYKVQTDFDILEPCILINTNSFVFGGLLFYTNTQKTKINFEYRFGASVDFISNMTSYFLTIIKRNPKIKIIDLMPDFYYFIKIMCPYGTPITSNFNLVEYFKNPDVMKSLTISSPEKSIVSINQLPMNAVNKNKEIKLTIKEVVSGVQHESKNGQMKYDIDIIGEIIISASNFDVNGEITFTLKPGSNPKFLSKAVLTDVLLHPSCLSCNYQTPVSISMQNRKPANDLSEKVHDESPNSPNLFISENSLLQSVSKRYNSIDSNLLNRRLHSISHSNSYSGNNDTNLLSSSITIVVKPLPDPYTLLSYKIMQYSTDLDSDNISLPFIASCKSPEPPIICSYQLEDITSSPEAVSNIVFRIRLNSNFFQIGEKLKTVEFSKLEIIFPFPNRPVLHDVSKCSVSQGKIIILEQNRHVMVWSVGSTLKKNEASLIGSIKFQSESNQTPLMDKFCVQSNAYVQVNFALKSSNLSGLSLDTKTVIFSMDTGTRINFRQECVSRNFKIWNSMGVCPTELCN